MKKIYILIVGIIIPLMAVMVRGGVYFNEHELLSEHKLKLIAGVPEFSRLNINTFFLQSIDDDSVILLTDFTGPEKIATLIFDYGSDNVIDRVVDFYPESNRFKPSKNESDSSHFQEDIARLKRDIISGRIYRLRENFGYKMMSSDVVREEFARGTNIKKEGYGYKVRKLDPDTDEIMGEFVFANKFDRYNLIFKTNYYKLYYYKIYPQITYSVYSRNSSDPVIKEAVEGLLDEIP